MPSPAPRSRFFLALLFPSGSPPCDVSIHPYQDPFPLYPGERLFGKVSPLQVVAPNTALRLRAIRDLVDGEEERTAGDEWLFVGYSFVLGLVVALTGSPC